MTRPTSEADWAAAFEHLALLYRWRWHHDHDSRRQVTRTDGTTELIGDADAADFPDYCMWRDRVLFAELKGTGGKLTEGQARVLDQLERAGAEVYVWWPHDLEDARRVLSRRQWDLRLTEDVDARGRT